MRSLEIARTRLLEAGRDVVVDVSLIPFEFDPPGTYPPEGQDWREYCEGYGPTKAKFLLERKLPRAFELGSAIGIDFSLKRRIVGTEAVNSALELAQEHGKGVDFALEMLSQHFEKLRDPNDPELIASVLGQLGVPTAGLRPAGPERAARNAELTAQARRANPSGGVPKFFVNCFDEEADVCEVAAAAAGVPGDGPTSPAYFERGFQLCATGGGKCSS